MTHFEFDGQNILTDASYHELYWGSTLWSSPESDWEHPAPEQLDRGPYRLTARSDSMLSFESEQVACFSGKELRARKTFRSEEQGTLSVEYELENAGAQGTFHVAPWEVTRVPGGGLSFYPHQETLRETEGMNLKFQDGIAWFSHGDVDPGGQKLWARGRESWLAHAASGLLHVKEFENLESQQLAPGEGDVELYSSGNPREGRSYVEVEAQGPYVKLAPGESASWQVRWHLVPLDAATSLSPGSSKLLQQARSCLKSRQS